MGEWTASCIKLKFAAQLSFNYTTADNGTKKEIYNLPKEMIHSDDDCYEFNQTESISLKWLLNNETKDVNQITFKFNQLNNRFSLYQIIISICPDTIFEDANNDTIQLVYHNSTFVTPLNMSYHCTREQTLNLTETIDNATVVGTVCNKI